MWIVDIGSEAPNVHERIIEIIYWMINTSNSGCLYMNYYLHIVLPLMYLYIKCITDDLLVMVE
jgi:hypothetical protein